MNDNPTPLLSLEHLVFAYKTDAPVFTDASLLIFPGETIGLWSENGSGKTTLLRLVTGLEVKASGRIVLEGRPVETPEDFRELRRHVGFVLQNAENQLFFPEVFDDVMFGPKNLGATDEEAQAAAWKALRALKAEDLAYSESLDLSGGQKRLVAIASVLAMEPAVLLLDEPTTGLDVLARDRLISLLRALPEAKVVVSHDPGFLRRVCTRFVTIREGRIEPIDASELPGGEGIPRASD